jgi:hypothetical protein
MTDPQRVVFYAGLVAIVLGTLAGMFPLWKSQRLSPASIERRCYWTGCLSGAVLLFVGVLPDWRSALFVSICAVLVIVVVAFRFSTHIMVRGRVYAFMHDSRQPDPPPALRSERE